MKYSVDTQIFSQITLKSNRDTPFRVSSGQMDFGCGSTRTAKLKYRLPPDAAWVGSANLRWENISNISAQSIDKVLYLGHYLVALGTIRGLPYEVFPSVSGYSPMWLSGGPLNCALLSQRPVRWIAFGTPWRRVSLSSCYGLGYSPQFNSLCRSQCESDLCQNHLPNLAALPRGCHHTPPRTAVELSYVLRRWH